MAGSIGHSGNLSKFLVQKWVTAARIRVANLQAELRNAEEELVRAEEALIRSSRDS